MAQALRILILEDRPSDAELLLHALKAGGFDPEWTRVETAADFLDHLSPDLDVILSDYSMPQFDAPEALRLLQNSGFDVPFIIVTGTISEHVAVECMKQGAADYLLKDRLGRLAAAVTRALQERKARDERREAYAALRDSEERYRLLVANIPDVIWTADHAGRVIFISPNVINMLGYTADEVRELDGGMWPRCVHPEDGDRVRSQYQALFSSGTPFDCEYRSRTSEGQWVWVRDRAMATYKGDNAWYAFGVASDITDRKRLEAEILHSQKMEAIGRLAGGLAHDFNNLLTVIIGYSQLLNKGVLADGPWPGMVEEIERAGKSGAALTRQLLAFSRKQILEPKVLDLGECVSNVKKMLTRLIGEDIDLKTLTSTELWSVFADPGQIEQVIINLAVNARDAMPDGGKLVIQTMNVQVGAGNSDDGQDVPPGSYAMLAVSDSGCGMDSQTMARIFEPFYTTKEQGKGTGLGLSTAYGIIQQSRGHIRVSSTPGQGSQFRIYLPRTEQPSHATQPVVGRRASGIASETILLVEDDEIVRGLAQHVLAGQGYS
ncbi:MAG TPA: ATP-binding protein, partial [Blastocatellia bacterium]|nr:ATP-binding protein [Blastocatellia bacterium]